MATKLGVSKPGSLGDDAVPNEDAWREQLVSKWGKWDTAKGGNDKGFYHPVEPRMKNFKKTIPTTDQQKIVDKQYDDAIDGFDDYIKKRTPKLKNTM
jgi:hypothetical protein